MWTRRWRACSTTKAVTQALQEFRFALASEVGGAAAEGAAAGGAGAGVWELSAAQRFEKHAQEMNITALVRRWIHEAGRGRAS